MTLLGKLYKLQEWLSVPDAARHMTTIVGEEVNEANILRLALDGHLKLSVRFVNPVEARLAKSVPLEEGTYEEFPLVAAYRSGEVAAPSKTNRMLFGFNADRGIFYRSDSNEHIKEVWDLPMIGNEKSRVEDEYQQLTTKHDVMLDCNAAALCVLVESPEGQMYVLQELLGPTPYETPQGKGMSEEAYHPAQCLPNDSVLVVRASALTDLQERFEKDLGLKETGKMTLPRPAWYTVDELAECWQCKSDLINHYRETGKLAFSERFSSKLNGGDVFLSLPPGGWSEANQDEMSYQELHDDLREEFTNGEKQYYIMLEEAERFEKEHGLLVGGVQKRIIRLEGAQGLTPLAKEPAPHNPELLISGGVLDDSGNTPSHTQESFPGNPGEKAVDGWKGMGQHFNRNPDYIRQHWAKEEGFPANKSKEGRWYAYPSRLNHWRANKKKDETAPPVPIFRTPPQKQSPKK